ncbi:flagellar FliJ family protein [Pseudoalteromonas marina]|uniref:Flagellar FliJ family protein n=1 Tax=Pseudoalteromonas marina TaxID=267375 RepID=A0ABT9FC19_9GAMM|nr:flagellar FliJ family protein [Pseudoalteromonas marina]MDP2564334.1 flagellar FliJ family protein [Pseudoalteromonas marina]
MLDKIIRVKKIKQTQALAELGRINNFVSSEVQKLNQLDDFCNTYTVKNQLMNVTVSAAQLENHNLFVGTLFKARATQEMRVGDFQKVLETKRSEMHKLKFELNCLDDRQQERVNALKHAKQTKQDLLMQDSFNSVRYYDR